MKFSLPFTVLFVLLATCHLILCEDWTHSGGDNDDEEEEGESRERQEAKNFQIPGISLPWVKTSRQHLSTIPKSLLVQINKYMDNDQFIKTPFFCRVEVVKGIKIIGKLDYNKQQCIIPGKFPLSSLNEQIQTFKDEEGILRIPSSGEWPLFEVLLNPRRLNLDASFVNLCQEGKRHSINGLLPARPVLAQPSSAPPPPSAQRNRHPLRQPSSYLAFYRYQDTSHSSNYFHFYPGVVQQVTENGTLAFYHGLYSVPAYSLGTVYVVAVLNSRMPPLTTDYRHRFNKL